MFGMSATTVALLAASAVVAGTSAYMQADASKKQADYQAKVNDNNAIIEGYNRSAALQKGESDAIDAQRNQAATLSSQRAALAANGVDMTSGSAIDLFASTKFLGKSDVNNIQSNAAREAWGYDVAANNERSSSQLERWKSANTNPALQAGMSAGSTLLSGAATYGSSAGGGGRGATMKIRGKAAGGWPNQ
jgi:hypothetical protein